MVSGDTSTESKFLSWPASLGRTRKLWRTREWPNTDRRVCPKMEDLLYFLIRNYSWQPRVKGGMLNAGGT